MHKRAWTEETLRSPVEPAPLAMGAYGLYEPRPRRRRLVRTVEVLLTFALGMAALHYLAAPAIAIFAAIAEAAR